MHWGHDNCRAVCGCYGWIDECSIWCTSCRMYSSCRRFGATNKIKKKKYADPAHSKSLVQRICDEES